MCNASSRNGWPGRLRRAAPASQGRQKVVVVFIDEQKDLHHMAQACSVDADDEKGGAAGFRANRRLRALGKPGFRKTYLVNPRPEGKGGKTNATAYRSRIDQSPFSRAPATNDSARFLSKPSPRGRAATHASPS